MSIKPPDMDKATLLEIARLATGCLDLRIGTWESTTLSVQGRRSIFRFAGTGEDNAGSRPWSVVLKQIQAPEDPDAPDAAREHCYYWEREYLLYKSGVPQSLTDGGLRAPRCYGTAQPAADLRWIWLEDLHDHYDGNWPVAQYANTAYHLGVFNGAYLVNKTIPPDEYLVRDGLRCDSENHISAFNRYRDPSVWEHPLLQRAYTEPVIETLDQLATERDKLLDILDSLPQTFCHRDAWHGNMAAVENADGSESTVLFDWALAGYGPPGVEIGNLIWSAFLEFKFKVNAKNVNRLEREVFYNYLQGLADSGWQPDPVRVRIAYLIRSVLLFGFQLEGVDHALAEDVYKETEQFYGQPIEELVSQSAQVTYFLIKRIDELRSYLNSLFS